jgi:YD repeat-containing protein
MTSAGGVTYTWDNNGNLINDGSATYLYDRANRLISTTLSGVTSLYAYNGDGARLKQTLAGTVTTYTQNLVAPLPVVLQAKTGSARRSISTPSVHDHWRKIAERGNISYQMHSAPSARSSMRIPLRCAAGTSRQRDLSRILRTLRHGADEQWHGEFDLRLRGRATALTSTPPTRPTMAVPRSTPAPSA